MWLYVIRNIQIRGLAQRPTLMLVFSALLPSAADEITSAIVRFVKSSWVPRMEIALNQGF